VTGVQTCALPIYSAARANGLQQQMAHDDRYDLADEYMQLCNLLAFTMRMMRT
jgi:hypothetical protein